MTQPWTVTRLAWRDRTLDTIALPRRPLVLREGFGSGLTTRAGDAPGTLWAVCDRGPNLKVKVARKLYGAEGLEGLADVEGAKIMPRTDIGPSLAELRVHGDGVELIRTVRVQAGLGVPLPGVPIPGGEGAACEAAYGLDGSIIEADPAGADTEGIAALADGGFWLGDEYAPSLIRVDSDGLVVERLVPAGSEQRLGGAGYEVRGAVPALAAKRRLNRGFEALALSADGKHLHLMFQSPLSHPDDRAHEEARHVRLWTLDAETGEKLAQYLYPLDPSESFLRDCAKGPFERSDVKVGELACCGPDALLVLERGSETSRIYRVDLRSAQPLGAEHWQVETRPTVEQLSAGDLFDLPVLAKRLLFDSDEAPEVAADLEGMALLSPTEIVLVSDNDFGVEGAETSFWRIAFASPVYG